MQNTSAGCPPVPGVPEAVTVDDEKMSPPEESLKSDKLSFASETVTEHRVLV